MSDVGAAGEAGRAGRGVAAVKQHGDAEAGATAPGVTAHAAAAAAASAEEQPAASADERWHC